MNADKVQQIREQTQQSHAELLRLIKGIHAAVSKPTQNTILQESMIFNYPSPKSASDTDYRGLPVQAHLVSSTPDDLMPSPKPRSSISTLMPQHGGAVAPRLSTDLLEINKSRFAVGQEQFMRFGRYRRIPQAVLRPESETGPSSFFGVEHPTVPQIAAELERIVFNMSSIRNGTSTSNDIVTQQQHRWLQGFEVIVQSWPITPAATKEIKQRRQKDGHALMLSLNSKISQANDTVRKRIYAALDKGGIERIFENLRESLRSVAVEKEIQIYEDDREPTS